MTQSLEIQFDRASKFYMPHEAVTGTISVNNQSSGIDYNEVTLLAEAFMDTVSAIRGKLGRAALDPSKRIMFMSKNIQVANGGKIFPSDDPLKFSFQLEPIQNTLPDSYVGVDFSIVYKVSIEMKQQLASKPTIRGAAEFNCKVTGQGIDPKNGKRHIP